VAKNRGTQAGYHDRSSVQDPAGARGDTAQIAGIMEPHEKDGVDSRHWR